MSKRNHYVDNRRFLEAFKNYLPVVRAARQQHEQECAAILECEGETATLPKFVRPQTPDYDFIGECLLKIANHLSFHPWYMGYTYRDEMIGDALENAIRYLENFDPEKSNNPFAYFTQVMMYAFQRRKTHEEKHSYIKQKSIEGAMAFFDTQAGDNGDYNNTYVNFIRDAKSDIVKNFEEKKAAKKKDGATRKRKKVEDPGIERFMVTVEEPATT